MNAIKIERASATSRDYNVLIDGEHRATFESNKRYGRMGYTLRAVDGQGVYVSQWLITKGDFEKVVLNSLANGKGALRIPTRREIDRALMIRQAERENEELDRQIAARRREVRREITRVALINYLVWSVSTDEYRAMAERMLAELDWTTLS